MKKWRVTGRCGPEQERIQEEAPYIEMWVHMSESWHPVTKKKVIFFNIKKKIYTLPLFLFYKKCQLLVRTEDPLYLHY